MCLRSDVSDFCTSNLEPELYLQSPTAVLISMIEQVADHLKALLILEAHVGDVRTDDETRHEKHRTTVLSSPVTIFALQILVKLESLSRRAISIFCSRGFRQALG